MVLNSVLLYSIVKCFCHSHLYVTGVVHSKNVKLYFSSSYGQQIQRKHQNQSLNTFFFFPTLALPPSLLVPAEDVYIFFKNT